jgi:hypothetical protein
MAATIRTPTRYLFTEILFLKISKVIIDSISSSVKIFCPARAPQAPSSRTGSLPTGRQEGASRLERDQEALPFRARSFKFFGSVLQGTPLVTAEAIGARFDWVIHDNTLEFSNSYE